jgi:hypothetical protein
MQSTKSNVLNVTKNHDYVPFMVITIRSILLSFITCQWVCEKGNTAGVNSKAGTAYLFRTPEITPVYSGLVELIRYTRKP